MRVSGIVACILAAAAVCTPCLALNTTDAARGRGTLAGACPREDGEGKVPQESRAARAAELLLTFYWAKGAEGSSLFNVFREKVILTVDGQAAAEAYPGRVHQRARSAGAPHLWLRNGADIQRRRNKARAGRAARAEHLFRDCREK